MNWIVYILKKNIPIVILRRSSFYLNLILLHLYYPLIFSRKKILDGLFILKRVKNPFLEIISIKDVDQKLLKWYSIWLNPLWTQDEYLIKIEEPLIIEPKFGWALEKNKLIYPSLGFSEASYLGRPGLFRLAFHTKKTKFPKCISFRDTGELNYFHFFNDVLSKFYFLRNHQLIDTNIPLVINKVLYKKDYFKYFLENTSLGKYNWFAQDEKMYIHSESAVFCKPFTHSIEIYNELLDDMRIPSENLNYNRKIYLNRRKDSLRYIVNDEEIVPKLKEKGYEIIDSSSLSFADQISVFSQTEKLIGIHGAGLTNMIFRRGASMEVTEIFSPYLNYFPFHYIMLARMFNFKYNAIAGLESKERLSGGFIGNFNEMEKIV
jgi:hypothetical protein